MLAHWLGDCTPGIESLDWRWVPRANSPGQSVAIGADWREPQYAKLLARSDCPAWARTFIDQVSGALSRPEAFDSSGLGRPERPPAPDGRFVLIDWPGLGAAPRGSQAALAGETVLRLRGPRTRRPWWSGSWPEGLDQSLSSEELRRRRDARHLVVGRVEPQPGR